MAAGFQGAFGGIDEGLRDIVHGPHLTALVPSPKVDAWLMPNRLVSTDPGGSSLSS